MKDRYVNLQVTEEERIRIDKVMERRLLGKSVNYRTDEECKLTKYIVEKYHALPIGWKGFDVERKTVFVRKLTKKQLQEIQA